jgi:hypothetical protein
MLEVSDLVAVVLAILALVLVEAGVDTFVVLLVASTGLLAVVVDELLLKENNPGVVVVVVAVAGVVVAVEGVVVVVEDVAGLAPKENDGVAVVAEVLVVLGTLACPNKPVVVGADVVVVEATGVVEEATAVLPKRPPLVGAVAGEPNNWVCACG